MDKFINLKQASFNVKEYGLKFTLFSKYASSLVANPTDLTNRFMTGVSCLDEESCLMDMLVDFMDISRLIVFTKQVEE